MGLANHHPTKGVRAEFKNNLKFKENNLKFLSPHDICISYYHGYINQ